MKPLYIIASFTLLAVLIVNIIASQLVSPIYFDLVNGQRQAAISFLQTVKSQPDFSQQLDYFKTLFGNQISEEVYLPDVQRQQRIADLEAILAKNPKAKDVLYALSLLYQQQGNQEKSQKYLKQAKELDPNIGE